jgi:hypothetical protein
VLGVERGVVIEAVEFDEDAGQIMIERKARRGTHRLRAHYRRSGRHPRDKRNTSRVIAGDTSHL